MICGSIQVSSIEFRAHVDDVSLGRMLNKDTNVLYFSTYQQVLHSKLPVE